MNLLGSDQLLYAFRSVWQRVPLIVCLKELATVLWFTTYFPVGVNRVLAICLRPPVAGVLVGFVFVSMGAGAL